MDVHENDRSDWQGISFTYTDPVTQQLCLPAGAKMGVQDSHWPFICKSDRLVKRTAEHAHVNSMLVLKCKRCLCTDIDDYRLYVRGEKRCVTV